MSDAKNTLHVLGFMGVRTAYLNVSAEEAKARFLAANPEYGDGHLPMDSFEFTDEFGVYEAWAL